MRIFFFFFFYFNLKCNCNCICYLSPRIYRTWIIFALSSFWLLFFITISWWSICSFVFLTWVVYLCIYLISVFKNEIKTSLNSLRRYGKCCKILKFSFDPKTLFPVNFYAKLFLIKNITVESWCYSNRSGLSSLQLHQYAVWIDSLWLPLILNVLIRSQIDTNVTLQTFFVFLKSVRILDVAKNKRSKNSMHVLILKNLNSGIKNKTFQ